MYRVRTFPRRGLGQSVDPTKYGYDSVQSMAADCSDWKNWIIHSACWGYSPAAWMQIGNFALQSGAILQPKAPAAVTEFGVPSTGAPTAEQVQSATDAAIALASQQTKAQNLAAFQSMIPVLDTSGAGDGGGGGFSTLALIALGLAAGVGVLLLTAGGRGRRR